MILLAILVRTVTTALAGAAAYAAVRDAGAQALELAGDVRSYRAARRFTPEPAPAYDDLPGRSTWSNVPGRSTWTNLPGRDALEVHPDDEPGPVAAAIVDYAMTRATVAHHTNGRLVLPELTDDEVPPNNE